MSNSLMDYAIVSLAVIGFLLIVLPFICVGYLVGWAWCGLVDGFRLARIVYEQYRDAFHRL